MRQTSAVVLVATMIAGAATVSVSAQQPSFGDLFGKQKSKVQQKDKVQREKEKAEKERQRLFAQPVAPIVAQPTVVCGMTLIPAKPQHDPGIRRTPPTSGQRFTMKSIVPKDCQRSEK